MLLFCTSRRKGPSGISTVSGRCFPAFLLTGEQDGDRDQLAYVNYDSGLNIKGLRYKKQRCEKTGKEKEERIGVMLQEEVFARSKGFYSMR